jgi:steroid delta-isomerase-like uncharacterized protein
MSIEGNKAIVRRYREAHNANVLDELDAIVAADLTSHNLLPGLPPGRESGKQVHQGAAASFPDLVTTTDDLIAEGDRVVERWTSRGTHTGAPFFGAPASGKAFTIPGISIYRIADGRIVEHWGQFDQLGALQQLGLAPTPGQ